MIGAASVQTSHDDAATGAVSCPVSASTAHLNVKGTAMVASFATSRSSIAISTRIFRSRRSDGQIYGHSSARIPSSEPLWSAEISRFKARTDRKVPSLMGARQGRRQEEHRHALFI